MTQEKAYRISQAAHTFNYNFVYAIQITTLVGLRAG